jgi:hypothetical protein
MTLEKHDKYIYSCLNDVVFKTHIYFRDGVFRSVMVKYPFNEHHFEYNNEDWLPNSKFLDLEPSRLDQLFIDYCEEMYGMGGIDADILYETEYSRIVLRMLQQKWCQHFKRNEW